MAAQANNSQRLRRMFGAVLGVLVLVLMHLLSERLYSGSGSSLVESAGGGAVVCVATADPVLLPGSRGTAEALWQLAVSLAHAGIKTHLILISQEYEICAQSIHKILLHAWETGNFISASCAFVGDSAGAFPLVARARVAKHWSTLQSPCQVSQEVSVGRTSAPPR